jgi:hypothetical protein
MKKSYIFIFFVLLTVSANGQKQNNLVYYDYFTDQRLRIDLVFAGNSEKQEIFLKGLHKEKEWSGTKTNLISPFDYGEYRMQVATGDGKIIYTTGFNNLFQEWRTTAEAKSVSKAFSGACWIPWPKDVVKVIFYERKKSNGKLAELFSFQIDPKDMSINCESENDFEVVSLINNGDKSKKVDLLFVAEGYRADQMDKFLQDARKFAGYLFNIEPYKSRKDDFNIWAVKSISKDSGPDIPHQGIWKQTVLESNFYTFKIDRYLTAPEYSLIASAVSNAPFDAIHVIVNTDKYGGGGIYNYYALSMSDHSTESMVFVHEFGHSFAGLGDEYYTSEVSYEDFYNLKIEPWEPNLTTKVHFEAKWEDMMGKDGVGLYEGGGYMAKGIFRPAQDCRMKTNTSPSFCPVCVRAINRMIDYYTK